MKALYEHDAPVVNNMGGPVISAQGLLGTPPEQLFLVSTSSMMAIRERGPSAVQSNLIDTAKKKVAWDDTDSVVEFDQEEKVVKAVKVVEFSEKPLQKKPLQKKPPAEGTPTASRTTEAQSEKTPIASETTEGQPEVTLAADTGYIAQDANTQLTGSERP